MCDGTVENALWELKKRLSAFGDVCASAGDAIEFGCYRELCCRPVG